jgi:lysophospholipase L1-like esterase
MRITNNILKNSLAVFFGFIIALIIIEIVLRVWQPIELIVKGNKIVLPVNRTYVINNDKIIKLDKNITHSKNKLGFRGDNPPIDFSNCLTILTVGGSTTECGYLNDNKTWTYVLGDKLKQNFKNLWINNAGIDGCSTFGHIVLLKDYIEKLKPKMVIFLVGINDVGLEDYRLFDNRILKNIKLSYLCDVSIKKILFERSELVSFTVNLMMYYKALKMNIAHRNLDLTKLSHFEIADNEILKMVQLHKDKYIESYKNRLSVIINSCGVNHILPIFVTQPYLYGQGFDDITGTNLETIAYTNDMNGKSAWKIMELYNNILREVALSHGVYLIDLAKEMQKSSKYYYDYHHYTDEGAQRVAEIIYQKLYPFMATKFKEHKIGAEP